MKHSKLFSVFTAAVLSVTGLFQSTAIPASAQVQSAATRSSAVADMVSAQISEAAANLQTAECCSIFSVHISGQEAQIHFQTDQNCRIVVGIYTDQYVDGVERLVGSAITSVQKEQTEASVRFGFTLPSSYVVKAYMIGSTDTLLSEEFSDQAHTREIRMLKQADINSFPNQRVLNLDEQTDTNFMVYRDSVHVLTETDTENIVLDADSESGRYVIKNLDSTIWQNEIVSIETTSGDAVVFRVKSLRTSDHVTTVTADLNLNPVDAFDYIKIEYHPSRVCGDFRSQDADAVQSRPPLYLPSDGDEDEETDDFWSFSASKQMEPMIRSGVVSVPGMDDSFPMDQLRFSSAISAAFDFGFLKTPHHDSSHFYLNLDYELTLKLSGTGELELPLLTGMMIPEIAGSRLNFGLYLKLALSGQVSGTMKLSTTLDDTGFYPHSEYDMDTDDSFYAGITVRTSLTLPAEIRGSTDLGLGLQAALRPAESHPLCTDCREGVLALTCSASERFDYRCAGRNMHTGLACTAPRQKLTDIYYSDALGGFGFGICPNRQLTIHSGSSGTEDPPQGADPTNTTATEKDATSGTANTTTTTFQTRQTTTEQTYTSLTPATSATSTQNGQTNSTAMTQQTSASTTGAIQTSNSTMTTAGTTMSAMTTTTSVSTTTGGKPWQADNDDGLTYEQRKYLVFSTGAAPADGYSVSVNPALADEIQYIDIPAMYKGKPVTMIGAGVYDEADWSGSPESYQVTWSAQGRTEAAGFEGCKQLRSIKLPETISVIGAFAFAGCNNLSEINLPNSITRIDASAFQGCSSMQLRRLPSDLRSLGDFAFAGCAQAFSDLTLPPVLSELGDAVFANCTSIRTLTFAMRTLPENTFRGCTALESVKLAAPLRTIRKSAFSDCTNLQTVSLPSTLRTIGKDAFRNTAALCEISLPEGVTTINAGAFAASSLKSVTLPGTVRTVDFSAFLDAAQLGTVTFLSRNASITIPAGTNSAQYHNIQISGYTGSTAEAFASENQFRFTALDVPQKPSEAKAAAGRTRPEANADETDNPQTATFRNLKPNTLYNFYDLLGIDFTSENLLYLSQGMSNAAGVLTIWYRPRKDDAAASQFVRSLDETEPVITAYQHAKIVYGDLTLDGVVDISDAVVLARFIAEDMTVNIESTGLLNADCNHDGFITSDDVLILLQFISKRINRL